MHIMFYICILCADLDTSCAKGILCAYYVQDLTRAVLNAYYVQNVGRPVLKAFYCMIIKTHVNKETANWHYAQFNDTPRQR